MHSLELYKRYFNQAYPKYDSERYSSVRSLVNGLPDSEEAEAALSSPDVEKAFKILRTLIKIKNYKSQIPFPEDLIKASEIIVEIKNNNNAILSDEMSHLFDRLLKAQGFQLPTVSAVFHFCHPAFYPIVDRNIVAACGLLAKEFPNEFDGMDVPALPATKSSLASKRSKYQGFVRFLNTLKEMHNDMYGTEYGYRELDMALMVYGASKHKLAAENANKKVSCDK